MKVSGRDVLAKSHRPAHNVSVADSQLRGESSVYEHLHRPYNGHNRFLQAATAGDLHFMRALERAPVPSFTSERPRRHEQSPAAQDVMAAEQKTVSGASRMRDRHLCSMVRRPHIVSPVEEPLRCQLCYARFFPGRNALIRVHCLYKARAAALVLNWAAVQATMRPPDLFLPLGVPV